MLPYLLALPIVVYEVLFIVYPLPRAAIEPVPAATRRAGALGRVRQLRSHAGGRRILGSMRTTLVYMLAVVVVAVSFGLFAALVLNRQFRGRTVARGVMTVPWAFGCAGGPHLPLDAQPELRGDERLRRVPPLDRAQPDLVARPAPCLLLGGPDYGLEGFPFYGLVILAAPRAVPADLVEAARVDGASSRQVFFAVALPVISPTLARLAHGAGLYPLVQAIHHHLAAHRRRTGRRHRDDRDSHLQHRLSVLRLLLRRGPRRCRIRPG